MPASTSDLAFLLIGEETFGQTTFLILDTPIASAHEICVLVSNIIVSTPLLHSLKPITNAPGGKIYPFADSTCITATPGIIGGMTTVYSSRNGTGIGLMISAIARWLMVLGGDRRWQTFSESEGYGVWWSANESDPLG